MKSFFTIFTAMLVFLAFAFSISIAQEGWDDKVVDCPSVLFIDDTLHMWYTGNSPLPVGSIGYAWSLDGISWEKNPGNPVLVDEPFGGWNEATVYEPNVIHDGSLFHMWYTSSNDPLLPGPIHIHHATSADGRTWLKDTDHNPVLSPGAGGSWDYKWVDSHCIIRVDTLYHMWYAGCNLNGVRIGHATSPDGITWTKDVNNPVLTFGALGSWEYPADDGRVEGPNVIYDGSTYHMWYSGGNHSRWQIGYATSADGVSWTKYEGNPVLKRGATGDWDDTSVGFCSVLLDTVTSTFRMWYSGSDQYLVYNDSWRAVGQIGYATSPDGITWTKHDNPATMDSPYSESDPVLTDIDQSIRPGIPEKFQLYQNYPNPFNPSTTISYQLAIGSQIELSIYNLRGQRVATLVNKKQTAGSYQVQWDATGFAGGVYFYRLRTDQGFGQTKKLLFLK